MTIVTDEDIAQALIKTKGLQYLAARMLDCSGGLVSERIAASDYLKEKRREGQEIRLDEAEKALGEIVLDKDLGGICFTLKTRGKERGYAETPQFSLPPDQPEKELAWKQELADFRKELLELKQIRGPQDGE